jgi:hypothetical protein
MSEAPKLSYASPIEDYLNQIGYWSVTTTTRILRAVQCKRKVREGALLLSGRNTRAESSRVDLYLRKFIHPQAHENYRVILKLDEGEFVIGSIGVQHGGAWSWGIDKIEELASGVRNAASRFRALSRAHHPLTTRSARSASRPPASSACAPAMEHFDGSRENGSGSERKFVIEGPLRFQGLLA